MIDHFKKLAKQLLKDAKRGSAPALTRLRASCEGPLDTTRLRLQFVQHAVAREAGFKSWSHLVHADGETLQHAYTRGGPIPIDCSVRMKALLAALSQWGEENCERFSLDIAPEREEDWTSDYAIMEIRLESIGDSRFIDIERAWDAIHAVVEGALGPQFNVLRRVADPEYKHPRKEGFLYCQLHGREIEIYRHTKAA